MENNFSAKINIKKISNDDSSLYITDVFDRVWSFYSSNNKDYKKELLNITNKRYFNPKNYWIYSDDDDFFDKSFNSIEKIEFAFAENEIFEDTELRLYILVEGGWVYRHFKIFSNYDELVKFAKKVEEKGIANLNYWTVYGSHDGDWPNPNIEELESYHKHKLYSTCSTEQEHNLYDDLANEDDISEGRNVYLSDGIWLKPDGSTYED